MTAPMRMFFERLPGDAWTASRSRESPTRLADSLLCERYARVEFTEGFAPYASVLFCREPKVKKDEATRHVGIQSKGRNDRAVLPSR